MRKLLATTLTRDPHKLYLFLVNNCTANIRIPPQTAKNLREKMHTLLIHLQAKDVPEVDGKGDVFEGNAASEEWSNLTNGASGDATANTRD